MHFIGSQDCKMFLYCLMRAAVAGVAVVGVESQGSCESSSNVGLAAVLLSRHLLTTSQASAEILMF